MTDKQNPIACEPCRQKKCKCDRTLPSCSQCSDPGRCIYPESGKRGLPQGYITHLENRLAATERALYSTYASLRAVSPPSFTVVVNSPQQTPSRTAAVAEWAQFPLRDPSDLERWWTSKNQIYGAAEEASSPVWSLGAGEIDTREKDSSAAASSNNLGHNPRPRTGNPNPREGRAEHLAELEPAVYF